LQRVANAHLKWNGKEERVMRVVRDPEALLGRCQQALIADESCEQPEWKLPQPLRTELQTAVDGLKAAADALGPAESDRTREQRAFEAALDEAEDLIRDAKRRLRGLLKGAELETVLKAYQLDATLGGLSAEFLAARLRALAAVSASQADLEAKLPDATLQHAAQLLTDLESHRPAAQAGLAERKAATADRNAAADALNTARRRIYFQLCAVFPDMDEDLRLDAYGFGAERQPRKAKEAEPAAPSNGEAGAHSFNVGAVV